MGTVQCPEYKVAIVDKNGTRYDVTPILIDLQLSENTGELAQKATVTIANILVGDKYMTSIVQVRNRVFVYADDGNKSEEVFRGFVWERPYKSELGKQLVLTCYDNLIYFQKSDDYQYFSAGLSTESICKTLCSKWGVTLNYKTDSITHPKLPLRGKLSDIFLTDLLEEVKKKKGTKSVMRSIQDAVHINKFGSNETVYQFTRREGGNTISTESNTSMDNMITKVIILGKEDKNDRAAVDATVEGNTKDYGTLQKILTSSTGTSLADAKAEAQQLLKENGKPSRYYSLVAVDIPWVRKGDKINVKAGDMLGDFYVLSVTHDAMKKTMEMECELV